MKRTATASTALLVFGTLAILGASPARQGQKPPVFRVRTDLMQLDVTVLDKDRRPVRGLTKDDFILLEDKAPQTIEGFTAIDVPDRVVPGAAWEKRASPDVVTNEIDNERIFVIVLDDAKGLSAFGRKEMKRSVEQFIDLLGPKDLVAVVFTGLAYPLNQNLTADKAKVLKTIRSYPDLDGNLRMRLVRNPAPGGPPHTEGSTLGDDKCRAHKEIQRLIEAVVTNLSTLPDRRKAIVYFGADMPWADREGDDVCGTFWMWRAIFAAAEQAHVTINPVDTVGLRLSAGPIVDHYRSVADYTGGHAVVMSNDFVPGLKQVLLENSSYYLLAYQPTNAAEDGTFRRLTVKVKNRSDVEVITRKSYWAEGAKPADQPKEPPPPQVEAMAGVLPLSALNLRASASVFAIPQSDRSVIAFAIGVRQPSLIARSAETVELLIKAFTADGDLKSSEAQTIPLTVPAAPADRDSSRYDLLARIEVPRPGKYEVRVSAQSDLSDTRGSVYIDVEVPDFKDAKLSLSGVVVGALATGAPVAPARALNDLTPVVPTTERAFAASDLVTAFVRVYQGGNGKLGPVTMKVRIADVADRAVFSQSDTLDVPQFDDHRAAPYQFRLPIKTLAAGRYLLTFEASAGKTVVNRDVVFHVR
jgi:VWFA-related protein